MNLIETTKLMGSSDFKDRFKAEYYQLTNRIEGLENMLTKYANDELNFTPNCSYDLLNGQLKAMELYLSYLEERAIKEDIEL